MIVRIFTEGQYEIAGGVEKLNELDAAALEAVQNGDEAAFQAAYRELLEHIRDEGTPVADDDLRPSDVMLPPPDVSLTEARREFSAHGLIPD